MVGEKKRALSFEVRVTDKRPTADEEERIMSKGTDKTDSYWLGIAEELSAEFAKKAADVDRMGELPKENLIALSESGLDLAILPKEWGGGGISYRTYGKIVFAIARGCPATACIWLMHTGAAEGLVMLSSPERSRYYLEELKRGKRFASALSEPASGNLFLSPVQEAIPLPDGDWKLEGAKRFVSGSEWADYFIVNIGIEGKTTFFGVERDDSVVIHDIWDSLGMRGTRSQLIGFNGTRLKKENRCGEALRARQGLIALGLPWLSLGIAQSAYDAMRAHAEKKMLPSTGLPLGHAQWVQVEVAQAYVKLKAAKLLAEDLLRLADEHSEETNRAGLEAKLMANQVAKEIADLGIRVGGGLAYTKALPFERHLRDAQAGGLMAYSSELCQIHIGQSELRVGK